LRLFDDGEDLFFAEEEVDLFVELHFRAGILADQDEVCPEGRPVVCRTDAKAF
jgi:hypothetical protein